MRFRLMLSANGAAQKPSKVQVFAHIVGRLGMWWCGCPARGLNATQRYRKKEKTRNIYITSLTPMICCNTACPQHPLSNASFFHGIFRHLTPPTPMSTRDPPDHCLAFWVPSSPSPTCHCPTRSLSAILTLCLPTRVQLSSAPTVCFSDSTISLDI